ncbi:MAG: serine/threonine protein kinase, partial [Planctomycetaceae bacterium]|nr:serine/threonine protein kinase [Planctomycetaceae bacterium]
LGIIGEGGMGIVLKGFESTLNRYVAIKVLAPHLASNGAARQRFSREARAAAAVLHENVIAIHRVEETRDLPYLVMPYIAGESLQKRLDDTGPLPLIAILRIGRQIAAGLAAAHAQGLVHRDVKPANILLERGVDRVTLTDFGLARAVDDATVTRSGVIAGTPQYMSPEQARGENVDARSDLFSLGSVLYAMATGRAPFRAETSFGILRRITDDPPRPITRINSEIPVWFERFVDRLHAKLPEDRYQTPEEVKQLMEICISHVQQPTATPLPPELAKPQRRWSLLLSVLLIMFCGFLFFIAANITYLTMGRSQAGSIPVHFDQADQPDSTTDSALFTEEPGLEHADPDAVSAIESRANLPPESTQNVIDRELNEIDRTLDQLERELGITEPKGTQP